MTQLVGHPRGEEPPDVVVGGLWQQRLDAEVADFGFDSLRISDGVTEPIAQSFGITNPGDRVGHRLEVERLLRLEQVEFLLYRFAEFAH